MKSRIAVAVSIVLLGFCYAGYLFWEFQSEEIPKFEQQRAGAEAQLSAKQAELRRLQQFAQNIEGVKLELKELNLQLEAALESMPRTFNLAALLRKLNLLAQNSGVELGTFKPRKTQEVAKTGAFYTTISIDFVVKGSFTQTLVFFDQVARLRRIVHVESLKLKSEGSGSGQLGAIGGGTPVPVAIAGNRSTASTQSVTEATIQAYRLVE